jgi:hypothetical protein
MISLIYGTTSERRKLALRGKVDFRPLLFIMSTFLIISYLSTFYFTFISGTLFSKEVIYFGMLHVPAVAIASDVSNHPDAFRFTMSIQWLASIVYILILFTVYCPFTLIMRVAAHKSALIKPVSYISLRGLGFILFALAYILGDLGITRFPTFFNGVYFSGGHPLDLFVHIINSGLFMPFFSWLSAFGTIMFYWMCLYTIANLSIIFQIEQEAKS